MTRGVQSRSASTGSSFAARRAGIHVATNAAKANNAITKPNVVGSDGATSNRSERRTRGVTSAGITGRLEVDHRAGAWRLIVRDVRIGGGQRIDRREAHVADHANDGRGVESALADADELSER